MKTLNNINNVVEKITGAIAAILLAVMVCITFAQVIVRLTKGAFPSSEELARYMQIYMTFLGMSIGVKRRELVAIEAVHGLLPQKGQKVLDLIVDIIIAAVSVILIYFSVHLVRITMMQKSPVLGIPMGLVYLPVIPGSILVLFHDIVNIANLFAPQAEVGPPSDLVEDDESEDV